MRNISTINEKLQLGDRSASGRVLRCVDPDLVEAHFIGEAGEAVQMPWLQAASEMRLEDCAPVWEFPILKGRRVGPGWWWTATNGGMVRYGFGAMRTQLMMLDFDPQVVAVACRPVELRWRGRGGRIIGHAPHLVARLADGSGLLIDCAGRLGAGRRLVQRAAHVDAAATAAGWHYRLVGLPSQVVEANVRWLAGYRHPRYAQDLMPRLSRSFRTATALLDGVAAVGDPIAVWPAVFHGLWRGLLTAPLDTPLHAGTLAVASAPSAAGVAQ